MSTSQFTNKEIADYVSAVLGGAGTDAEKAAAINAAAQQYDVTRERLAASTGYGLDVVNQYLGALPTTNAGVTPTSTGALSTVTATQPYSATSGSAVDTTSSATSALSNQVASAPIGGGTATPTGALPTSTTQGALQTALTSSATQPPSTLDVYGLNWNTAADLATKQGYIETLLDQGVTPQQLVSKIVELDPVNATAANFYALGIPSQGAYDDEEGRYLKLSKEDVALAKANPITFDSASIARTSTGIPIAWIKDEFNAIYDDPSLTGPQKAIKVQQLANTNRYSNADLAEALGVGEDVLGTFLNQEQPNWERDYSGRGTINFIDPVTGKKVDSGTYYSTANTPEAIADRMANAPYYNFLKNSSLPNSTLNKIWNSTDTYLDPAEGKDYTDGLRNYLAKQLTDRGITDFWQLETQVIPGKAAVYKRGYKGAGVLEPEIPETIKVIDTKTGKQIDNVLFDDKAGTKYIVTSNGIQKQFDPTARLSAQLAQYVDPSSSGGAWGTEAGGSSGPGFGPQGMMRQIAQRVQNNTGVSDINQLGVREVDFPFVSIVGDPYGDGRLYKQKGTGEDSYWVPLTEAETGKVRTVSDGEGGFRKEIDTTEKLTEIYNKQTGQKIRDGSSYIDLGGWGEGPGITYASMTFDANGKPKVSTYGSDSSDLGTILPVLAFAALPFTLGASSALLGGEAALLAAESGIAAGGLGVAGAGYGAAASGLAGLGSSLTSQLTSALPAELVQAGQTLASTFNTVRPYLQGANALYQASQGNIAGAISSGLGAAGGLGVPGAAEAAKIFNLGYGATQGNYLPVVQELLNQSGAGGALANTKIAGDFTVSDAFKGASFLQALQSENPTVILNAAATLTESQDLKVAAAANNFVNILNNPKATAFDIAMGADRIAGALNTASKQPPPKGALPTSGQSTVMGALGTDTTSGAAGSDVVDEYNVTGGGGALISSGNPTEDQQIAILQRQNAADQALRDYVGPGNDLSREGFVSQLQSLGFTKDQAEGYAQQADQQINMQRVGADVMNRYSKIDPEFGTPQLERNTAVQELVAAGYSSERANEILDGVDRDVAAARAAALDTKASNQAAINAGAGEFAGADQRAATAAGAGEFAGADTARAVNEKISAAKTFGEAYSEARNAFGAGATFNWKGKLYSTDTFQENPALGLVPVAGSGRGQAAGKTAEQEAALLATAEELKRIDPAARAALLDPASINYSEMSPESNAQGLTQTAADRLVQSAIPVNAIKTAFGMTTEAAGNTLKAFGTIGESMGFNTAQMSDYGRRLENIAQELYPQALKSSEDEVKGRFASANSAADIGRAIKDSILNNPGAVAKMIGVEGLQELPNILLAVSTGGASAIVRYGGMLAGLGLDVVESAGLQGAQKVDEGLAKGLTRAQAVKSAVDDMKAAGAVTAVMTAAADKIPFGGTVAKTLIKGSAGEGIEEYVIARATGQDHMSALRQAAFGAMIGGPTEASLQGAGNLTNVTINGDTMIGTYEDGTKVSISEPAGATDLKIDIIKPTDTSVNVSNALTADLSSGADLSTSINNVVSNNITADLSGTIDSTVKAVIDNGVDLSQGVTDLTSSAVANTGDTTAVINNVVSSLASNGTDLNANAGSIVTGAVSGGASVTDAVDTTLKAVTANGGNVADAAASIITSVSASGDTAQVANATTAVVNAAITSGSNVTATTSNAVDAALAASGGSTDAVTQVVGGVASQGNNDATAAAVSSAVTATGDTSAAVNAALTNGGDASTVLSTASNAAITAGTDTNTAVAGTLASALNNNVDTATAVGSTVKGALDAGADSTSVIDATVTTIAQSGGDVSQAVGSAVDASLAAGADTSQTLIAATSTAITNGGDASTVVSNVVNSAVNNGASLADATASSVATAIVSGADANAVIQTLTNSNSNLAVESGSEGGVTTVVASDGTSNTQVSMDANSQTVTTTTTNAATGETKQVTIQGDTTTEIKSDVNTGVVTQIVSNPDRDQIVTTTWNADNTVTVTTKSGDSAGTTETLTADTAPVKPKLDPIAAVVPVKTTQAAKTATTTPKASFNLPGAAAGLGLSLPIAKSDYDLGVLKSSGDTTLKNPLEALMERVEQMNQIDPTLAAVMSQRLGIQQPQMPTYTYGQESSIEDILGLREPKAPEVKEEFMAYAEGGYVEPLRAKGGAMNLQFMDRGGALPGGREDFKGGKHVAGDGDGQSDDIPAWLADSEFVLPADVVAALGNGSTKAGTNKLYEMMYAIRKRARSTGPKDLPPPAYKSPLDYIKKSAKR